MRAADRACLIGGAAPAASYLNIDAIIDAARRSGADAVHPGYGFLAENAAFADACRTEGLVFIGPSPEAIELMGDKARAKDVMRGAGVPCVPGYQGDDQSEERLAAEAERIGFPVMIKASAGGGGRGMRRARARDELIPLLRSARSEAEHAFGDPTLLIERAIEGARHVEIQVFGDRHGNAIHLGERDCSVQRRHQKLIEEAPSPAVSPELARGDGRGRRRRRAGRGLRRGRDAGVSARRGRRLLLHGDEHAAAGRASRSPKPSPASTSSSCSSASPAAKSFRCARTMSALPATPSRPGFAPKIPTWISCRNPGASRCGGRPRRLRVDHAIEDGADILPFYDSMIAKLIAHGATREEARRKLVHGLAETVALGRCHQCRLSAALPRASRVRRGRGDHRLRRHASKRRCASGRDASAPPQAALAALALHVTEGQVAQFAPGRTLAPTFSLPLRFRLGGQTVACDLRRDRSGSFSIAHEARTTEIEIIEATEETLRFRCEGVEGRVTFCPQRTRSLPLPGRRDGPH